MRDKWASDKGTTNKEQILAKLRNAIIEKPEAMFKDIDLRSDTWKPISEEDGTAVTFVQKFMDMGGFFIYLESENELGECLKQLAPQNGWDVLWCMHPETQKLLEKCGISYTTEAVKGETGKLVCITGCESLVAQTGSIIFSDQSTRSRKPYTDADVLLVVAKTSQIVAGLKEGLQKAKEQMNGQEPSQTAILTGLSLTFDIEQEELKGVFGPRQMAVFLMED